MKVIKYEDMSEEQVKDVKENVFPMVYGVQNVLDSMVDKFEHYGYNVDKLRDAIGILTDFSETIEIKE